MKRLALDFLRRGLIASGIGPIVLAIVYLILKQTRAIEALSVNQVVIGIFSLFALAFIAGGMNVVYQIERLPLMVAILIHGSVLYVSYLITYILNDWLQKGMLPFLVFTGIFVVGYLAIWVVIYLIIKSKTEKLNKALNEKQQSAANSSST